MNAISSTWTSSYPSAYSARSSGGVTKSAQAVLDDEADEADFMAIDDEGDERSEIDVEADASVAVNFAAAEIVESKESANAVNDEDEEPQRRNKQGYPGGRGQPRSRLIDIFA